MAITVTVTYGQRWNYLQQMLDVTQADPLISKIIVVDNGTTDQRISKINLQYSKVEVLRNEINTGSASGFKKGLQRAVEIVDDNFVLILDDDNVINEDSLRILLKYWNEISEMNKSHLIALAGLRMDRKYLIEASLGGNIKYLFPLGNDCFGFDVQNAIGKLFYRTILRKSILKRNETKPIVQIPMAPYGGLFFHKAILKKIGYPDERYFVYTDD